MERNLNSLTGIEFENLCQVLLQRAGFDVQTTRQSGDGGIDLIALNHQPFLSGKYIIQCKRYTGGVGEPIIRDLYGVVMSERANKGILITTGYFTMSAIQFASDKNLELIDGEKLEVLLAEYKLIENNHPIKYNHFTQYECFDSGKYEFYKNMINQNKCTIEMGKDFLFSFMFNYMKEVGEREDVCEMIHAKFAEEYIHLFDWYIGKYYKRWKDKYSELPYYNSKYKGIAQLLNFDLFDYVQSRYSSLTKNYDIGLYYHREPNYWDNEIRVSFKLSDLHNPNSSLIYPKLREWIMEDFNDEEKLPLPYQNQHFYDLINILSICSYFNIESGLNLINKLLYGATPEFKEWVEGRKIYKNAIQSFQIQYSKYEEVIINNQLFSKYPTHDGFICLDSYFDKYKEEHKEKLQVEIQKIEQLLATLL